MHMERVEGLVFEFQIRPPSIPAPRTPPFNDIADTSRSLDYSMSMYMWVRVAPLSLYPGLLIRATKSSVPCTATLHTNVTFNMAHHCVERLARAAASSDGRERRRRAAVERRVRSVGASGGSIGGVKRRASSGGRERWVRGRERRRRAAASSDGHERRRRAAASSGGVERRMRATDSSDVIYRRARAAASSGFRAAGVSGRPERRVDRRARAAASSGGRERWARAVQ